MTIITSAGETYTTLPNHLKKPQRQEFEIQREAGDECGIVYELGREQKTWKEAQVGALGEHLETCKEIEHKYEFNHE